MLRDCTAFALASGSACGELEVIGMDAFEVSSLYDVPVPVRYFGAGSSTKRHLAGIP